jgi:hypothetical protein
MSDVPGQQPLFDAPLPEPSGIVPPAKKQKVKRPRRSRARPNVKTTVVACRCPKCGWEFLKQT